MADDNNNDIKNLDKKLYRFALLGMSRSGKTCILTAMGMVRRPTTDGSYCGSIPASWKAPPEVKEGWKNLEKYEQSLKVGEPPEPTEPQHGDFPRYRYVYTNSKTGDAYFEIIDYAGELIHLENITQEYSHELLKHLIDHDVDGIIVLVSVPKEGEKQSDIPNEIASIHKAFSFLKAERTAAHRYPIALVLTKWDRRWTQDEATPPNDARVEAERLAQFMEQYTAYQTVHDVLEGFAAAGGDGKFKMFPVSALGRCSDGRAPDKVPLESYGLPFVFGWLVQAANDADFWRFEEMQSDLPWWRWQIRPRLPLVLAKYLPAWSVTAWKKWEQPVQGTWSLAKSLLERLPKTEQENERRTTVKSAKKRLTTVLWAQVLITAMILFVVLPSIGIRVSDWRMLAVANTVIHNPASELKDLERVEKKLISYVSSSRYLVPFHGRCDAGKSMATDMLERIYAKYENSKLTQFRALPIEDNDEIQALGQKYLDRLPNGVAREEVVAKMREALTFIEERQAENLWAIINSLPIESNNEEIQRLGGEYLSGFLNGKNRDEVIAKMGEAQRLYAETVALKDWEDFARSVRGALEEGNVPSALSSLANRNPKNAEWMALCEEILSKTTETVRREIGKLGTQHDRIKDEIKRSRDTVRDQLSNRGISQADEVIRELNALLEEIEGQEDRFLYEQVRNTRTRTAVENYLEKAPIKTMRQYVANYLQYIDKMEGNINLTITATLHVGNAIYRGSSPNSFTLVASGSKRINTPNLNDYGFARNANIELIRNPFAISGKLTDRIAVRVEMRYQPDIRNFSLRFDRSARDQGKGNHSFNIGDFRNNQIQSFTLQSESDPNVRHTLTLRAAGFPQEPPLPEWRP